MQRPARQPNENKSHTLPPAANPSHRGDNHNQVTKQQPEEPPSPLAHVSGGSPGVPREQLPVGALIIALIVRRPHSADHSTPPSALVIALTAHSIPQRCNSI